MHPEGEHYDPSTDPEHVFSAAEKLDPSDPSVTPLCGIERADWAEVMQEIKRNIREGFSAAFTTGSSWQFSHNVRLGLDQLKLPSPLSPEELGNYDLIFRTLDVVSRFLDARQWHKDGLGSCADQESRRIHFERGLRIVRDAQLLLGEFRVTPALEEEFPGIGMVPRQMEALVSRFTSWLDAHPEVSPQKTDTPPATPPPST